MVLGGGNPGCYIILTDEQGEVVLCARPEVLNDGEVRVVVWGRLLPARELGPVAADEAVSVVGAHVVQTPPGGPVLGLVAFRPRLVVAAADGYL